MERQDLWTRADAKTRRNEYEIKKTKCLYDVRKFVFPKRSNDIWNVLEAQVIKKKKHP